MYHHQKSVLPQTGGPVKSMGPREGLFVIWDGYGAGGLALI